ncbi:MAG: LysR family transcriptional regulator [Ferrovibrionaceae bacterium]
MDLRSLSYFIAVYEEGNLSLAARRCHVSQPSISVAMQALEAALGGQLLIRHSKGVSPTPAGEQLYGRAIKLLADVEAIRHLFRQDRERTPLTVAATRFLPFDRVGVLLKALGHAAGGHDVRVVALDQPADLRLVTRQSLRDDEIFYPLWEDRFLLALPRAHPLTLRATVRLVDLAGLAWIARSGCEVDARLQARAAAGGVALEIRASAESDDQALALVEAEIGCALVPQAGLAGPQVALRELADMPLDRNVGVAHGRGWQMTEAIGSALAQCRRRW